MSNWYKEGKKYIQDTKTGRRWKVPEWGGKPGQRKERGKKEKYEKKKDLKTSRLPEKKRRRFKLAIVALWEIQKFQKSTGFFIHKFPFTWWVREIAKQQKGELRFNTTALLTLQEVAEAYVVNLF